MARTKKDGKTANFFLSKDVIKMLDEYSRETGIPKTTIVEKALKEYISAMIHKK